MRVLLAMLGMVTSFAWLNLECTAWFRTGGWIGPDVNSMWQGLTRSLLWLFFGSVLVLWGLIRRRKPVRWSGLVVLVLSTVKVFIVDVWDLEALYRVGSFVALGLVLLLGAWVYSRAAGVLDREEGVGPDSKEVA